MKHFLFFLSLAAWLLTGCETHAAQTNINVGTSANDGTGDTLRTAFTKINANTAELYNLATAALPITNGVAIHCLIIQTNGSGVDGINGYLILQPMTGVVWATNTFTSIWYNQQHSGAPELQFGCDGAFSFTEGMNQQRAAFCHFGGSGHYHGIYALQYDEDRIASAWNGLADTSSSYVTNNGYSHFLNWCAKYFDVGLNTAMTRHVGFRLETKDNTTTNMAFNLYSHVRGWNQLSTAGNEARDEIGGTFWVDENYQGMAVGFPRAYFTNTIDRGVYAYGNQSSTVSIDFATNDFKTVTLTGSSITFSTANRSKIRLGGRQVNIELLTGATAVTSVTWPTDWQWVGNKPTSFGADTVGLLRLTAFGSTDNQIVAECPTNSRVYAFANSEATAYFTAAGITSSSQKVAYDNFITAAKAHGYWTKLEAFYPFGGGTVSGAAIDLKGTHNITWTGTPTVTSDGVTFDGVSTTIYGDTGANPSSFLTGITDGMAGVWPKAFSTGNQPADGAWFLGCASATPTWFGIGQDTGNFAAMGLNVFSSAALINMSTDFRHWMCANRSALSSEDAWIDGVQTGGSGTAATAIPSANIYIGGRHPSGTTTPDHLAQGTYMFAWFGHTCTSQNLIDMYNDMSALKTGIGR